MIAIGVRELKAQLSRYLREVAAGEIVLVTDRGRVVAQLQAPSDVLAAPESDLDRRVRLLAQRIPLTIPKRRTGHVYARSPLPPSPDGTAERLIDEMRDENDRLR